VIEALYQRCLAANPTDRPTAAEALAVLQAGARLAGQKVYIAPEFVPHIIENEDAHWHNWSIAYRKFEFYDETLACNDRSLKLARQYAHERPESLAHTLLVRANILKDMGARALAAHHDAEVARLDQQVEATYQEALNTYPSDSTPEGRRGRAVVWKQIGVFNDQRKRYAYADDAYRRALKLQPDMVGSYYNRALSQRLWGLEEAQSGRLDSAIAHLRQARVYATTAFGMDDPKAAGLLRNIEDILRQLGDIP
jgi:tetratricopeptide (TPR) repeat protein